MWSEKDSDKSEIRTIPICASHVKKVIHIACIYSEIGQVYILRAAFPHARSFDEVTIERSVRNCSIGKAFIRPTFVRVLLIPNYLASS